MLFRDIVVAAHVDFTPILFVRLALRPVVPIGIGRPVGVGIKIRKKITGNVHTGELQWPRKLGGRKTGKIRSGGAAAYALAEIAVLFRGSWNASGKGLTANLIIPFLVEPEEEFIFHDRAGNVVAEAIAAQFAFAGLVVVGEPSGRIQGIVAAGIKDAAVPLILTGARIDADNRAGGLSVFGAVGIAEHFELGNRVHRGVNQNGAVGAHVIVVDAVYQEQVVVVRVPVDGKVAAATKP